jgi:hypothetical protein
MIRETIIDHALNRLSAHFGHHLLARPPASAAELGQLEHIVGPLPRDLTVFFSASNGLRVDAKGPDSELYLWSVHDIERAICQPPGPPILTALVPVRGDLMGDCDCLVLGDAPVRGTVVRWDAWAPGAELIASSFGSYFDCWTQFLVEAFGPDGQRLTRRPPVFTTTFTSTHDPQYRSVCGDHALRDWLRQVDRACASGSDYE